MLVLEDFFINFCILCTGIFLIHHYFLKTTFPSKNSLRCRIRKGLFHGTFGIVLMHFGIQLQDGVLIDLRIVPIMIAASVGGRATAFTATAVILAFRLSFYPLSLASLNNIYVLGISALLFTFIRNIDVSIKQKWRLMLITFILTLGSTFFVVIPEIKTAVVLFVQYSIAVAVASYVAFNLKFYLLRNDEDYAKFKWESEKDPLTGLNNVRSFERKIQELYGHAKEHRGNLSLMMIDIDHFKKINDTYGHPAGDKVIQKVANILLLSAGSDAFVSRNGGEEFSILVPDCDRYDMWLMAERIRKAVAVSRFRIGNGYDLRVTVSIGFASKNDKGPEAVSELINRADQGLYNSKKSGRNKVMMAL